jgi:hypothetical protein
MLIHTWKKEKKIHGSWENVWECFSSHQWKGGGIDSRVCTGLSPGLGSTQWTNSPDPLDGHTTGLRLVGECLFLLVLKNLTLDGSGWDSQITWDTFRFGTRHGRVPVWWQEDLRYVFLMMSTHVRLWFLGVNPFEGVNWTGFVDGDCLWDLSLGWSTGDGKFDGESFWVGCGWFFLGVTGEGKRKLQVTYWWVVFAGRHEFPNNPFYVISKYYILISGGFSTACVRPSRTVLPILDTLVRHVHCWSFDNLTTSFTHWRQWRTCFTSLHHGLHGAVGMVSYEHVVFVTCCFCFMFRFRVSRVVSDMLLMCICVCTSYYCELVVGLRTQFCTLLEVWGGWELGCWLLTWKRVCTPRIRGSKYRWTWSMTHLLGPDPRVRKRN